MVLLFIQTNILIASKMPTMPYITEEYILVVNTYPMLGNINQSNFHSP